MGDFDIERFLSLSGAVELDDLDWQAAKKAGITAAEAKILRYMADTETHTILYLRDLLAGHTCQDAEVTAFLSVWVYEELWHGRAIDRLLAATGHPPADNTFAAVARSVSWREPLEAMGSHLIASLTPKFVAVHMAWGAINELTAAAAYKLLQDRSHNLVLKELLTRIRKQERKHYAFYWQQAQRRLQGDKWAQRLCSAVLKAAWTPVGSGVGQGDSMGFIAQHLFSDATGQAALEDIDAGIRRLPGLEWFNLCTVRVNKIIAAGAAAAPRPQGSAAVLA
jgi:rubrerythrin